MTTFKDLRAGRATIPAVAYITDKGRAYYGLPDDAPEVTPFEMEIQWSGEELRYGAGGTVTGIHRPYGGPVSFGAGKLYFFRYCTNPDEGSSGVPVNRISVLGLTARGGLGFFREVTYTDVHQSHGDHQHAPPLKGCESDAGSDLPRPDLLGVQILASGDGEFQHELVIEAGSPTALFER